MPRTFAFALIPLFTALLSGCGASTNASQTAPETCQEGYFWNGTECEKRRSIVIEEGRPSPTGTPSSAPPPSY
jgi:hypothetical protein